MKAAGLVFVPPFFSYSLLFSQTVCLGATEQCVQAQSERCANEPAPANLRLGAARKLTGVARDQTGATFQGDAAVQLREIPSGRVLQVVRLADDGRVDLNAVAAGNYRLIVVKWKAGKVSRLAELDQPRELKCSGSRDCKLDVMPRVHGSDNPIDFCEPK